MLTGAEMQLGRGETIADTARVLSRYVDAIMIRTLDHDALHRAGRAYATVPVINGLTRLSHPCQVMADVMTFEEHRGPIKGRTVAWTGDANNVLASWMHAAEQLRLPLQGRDAAGAAARPNRCSTGSKHPARAIAIGARSREGGRRAPTASSPTPGCRWATRTASSATTCSSPIRSTRG